MKIYCPHLLRRTAIKYGTPRRLNATLYFVNGNSEYRFVESAHQKTTGSNGIAVVICHASDATLHHLYKNPNFDLHIY